MNRIYHTWDKWECYLSGFYENSVSGMSKQEAEEEYRCLLSNESLFASACNRVITEWKYSCQHYLTNENMNRIAWMGQASLSIARGIPACFRSGYNLLSDEEKKSADNIALEYINKWMSMNGYNTYTMDEISSKTQANLY